MDSGERKPIRLRDGSIKNMTVDEVLEEYERFISHLVQLHAKNIEWDEACQIARIKMWEAYLTYDVNRGVKYASYAGDAIRYGLYSEIRSRNRKIRNPHMLSYLDAPITQETKKCLIDMLGKSDEAYNFFETKESIQRKYQQRDITFSG